MKNILKISIAALASAALLSGCIKETFPTDRATSDQLAGSSTALEAMVKGIPTALIQPRSLSAYDKMHWNFALPAIHLATDSAAGEIVITGDTGYDWFSQWGANNSLGDNYAVGDLPWKNYYTWIKAANDIISTIDPEALTTATKHVLGFAYAYRASFYLDLVRIYEFKENKYTSGDGVVGLAVPIVTETTTEAEAKANPRATAAEVYEKVIFPDLEKAAAAGEQVGQKVGAQPKADDRHIPLIHQRAQLVDLLWCEELALIGNDDIHAGVLIKFFDDIILRQDDIRLFCQADAGFDDIGAVTGIHRGLDEPDGHAQLLVVELGNERLGGFGAAHCPVFEIQLCHFRVLLRFGAGHRLPPPPPLPRAGDLCLHYSTSRKKAPSHGGQRFY